MQTLKKWNIDYETLLLDSNKVGAGNEVQNYFFQSIIFLSPRCGEPDSPLFRGTTLLLRQLINVKVSKNKSFMVLWGPYLLRLSARLAVFDV